MCVCVCVWASERVSDCAGETRRQQQHRRRRRRRKRGKPPRSSPRQDWETPCSCVSDRVSEHERIGLSLAFDHLACFCETSPFAFVDEQTTTATNDNDTNEAQHEEQQRQSVRVPSSVYLRTDIDCKSIQKHRTITPVCCDILTHALTSTPTSTSTSKIKINTNNTSITR